MAEEKKVIPTALTIEKAAQALGVGRETLEADIAAGAPVNADGTINLVHYAAWLVKELVVRGD
jgi:plasmid maintenance system antidote protein VapI